LFPGIAEALHDIRTTATDEERAWEEDRARHPEHIHADYNDRWWPAEETGQRVMRAARTIIRGWGLTHSTGYLSKVKARSKSAKEEGEHYERMHQLQRYTHSPERRIWTAQRNLPLLTDKELLAIMPTTMDWGIRRALRDRADEELKRKAKKNESKTNADRPGGTKEETRGEETARPSKRARTETEGGRKAAEDGASNSNTDDEDLQEVDNEAGWRNSDEAEATARFEMVKRLFATNK
jgi:hypothetical protein